ncbi:HAMP domain-containing histidine kinase [Ruminococcaceae bacterium OttesenSCG-928-L11]|nr:HAMP domain-containing histidine kinase [Ruminococcaceae bacterium OttesenSCG-928-L11]
MHDDLFYEQIAVYIAGYRELPLPALICDTQFQVRWGNNRALKGYQSLVREDGVQRLLQGFDVPAILEALRETGEYAIDGCFPLVGERLVMSPVRSAEGDMAGILVVVTGAGVEWGADREHRAALTADSLLGSVRDEVGRIFETMDNVFSRAALLEDDLWVSRHLNRIGINAYHILRNATNISEYSKLQNGVPRLKHTAVDVFEWLQDIRASVTEMCAAREIPVVFDIADGDGMLSLDFAKLEMAFYNVFLNSVRFTRAGNEITVRAFREGGEICIAVEDRGIGIAPELLEKVFEPYYSQPSNDGDRGMGLGLTVARQLMRLMRGDVLLESELYQGTKTTLVLQDTMFSRRLPFEQGDGENILKNRFSNLYVGLLGIVERPDS